MPLGIEVPQMNYFAENMLMVARAYLSQLGAVSCVPKDQGKR